MTAANETMRLCFTATQNELGDCSRRCGPIGHSETVSLVASALWLIESRLSDIALAELAGFSGVSRYQLLRAFSAATGWSARSCSPSVIPTPW